MVGWIFVSMEAVTCVPTKMEEYTFNESKFNLIYKE